MRGARCEGGVEVEGVVGHDVGYSEVIRRVVMVKVFRESSVE